MSLVAGDGPVPPARDLAVASVVRRAAEAALAAPAAIGVFAAAEAVVGLSSKPFLSEASRHGFGWSGRDRVVLGLVLLVEMGLRWGLMAVGLRGLRGQPAAVSRLWIPAGTFVRLVAVLLGAFVPIAAGLALLVVPGIWLSVRWSQLEALILDGRASWFEALHESSVLTAGSRWRVLAILAVFNVAGLTLSVVSAVAGGLVGGIFDTAVVASAWVGGTLLSALRAFADVVVYLELRGERPSDPAGLPD